jgi:hypothetical protein
MTHEYFIYIHENWNFVIYNVHTSNLHAIYSGHTFSLHVITLLVVNNFTPNLHVNML